MLWNAPRFLVEHLKKQKKTFEELKQEMQENKVKVLTIHSAKGLEADNVVVIGAKKFNSEEKKDMLCCGDTCARTTILDDRKSS